MKIKLDPQVALLLETASAQLRTEFSGLGFVRFEKPDFVVYDFVILNVGSGAYTEIDPKQVLMLLDRPDAANLKLWAHKHGLGNGIPGRHNWSGTDHATCRETPLGGIPELAKWSIAIVRTPLGWVGRYDSYGENGRTIHLEVVPSLAQEITPRLHEMRDEYWRKNKARLEKAVDAIVHGDGLFRQLAQLELDAESYDDIDDETFIWDDAELEVEDGSVTPYSWLRSPEDVRRS